jgi:hypothetical protein
MPMESLPLACASSRGWRRRGDWSRQRFQGPQRVAAEIKFSSSVLLESPRGAGVFCGLLQRLLHLRWLTELAAASARHVNVIVKAWRAPPRHGMLSAAKSESKRSPSASYRPRLTTPRSSTLLTSTVSASSSWGLRPHRGIKPLRGCSARKLAAPLRVTPRPRIKLS